MKIRKSKLSWLNFNLLYQFKADMNRLHNLFFLLCSIFLIACSSDNKCTVDDWLGTYSTMITCNINGLVDGVQRDTTISFDSDQKLSIVKLDDQTILMNNGAELNAEIKVLGCEISIDSLVNPINMFDIGSVTYILNGNQITGMTSQNLSDLEFLCETLFTRDN